MKPKLYIHVGQATHFLQWERKEFEKYFDIISEPNDKAILMAFGPDVLEEASKLPAALRFATLFPGFGHNPVYNPEIKELHRRLISRNYTKVFINPGPLEIAYKGLKNVTFYQFSVDVESVTYLAPRQSVKRLLHVSSDYPQKDWERSRDIMSLTGLKWEVYPPRSSSAYSRIVKRQSRLNKLRWLVGMQSSPVMPQGYVAHDMVIKKYQQSDGFVHVARDIKNKMYLDGKYTASLIEAGLTGCILFWHDTFGLGNNLKTVFDVPLDPHKAAAKIQEILKTIDIEAHSEATHKEMAATFNPVSSVHARARVMLEEYNNFYE